MSPVPVYGEGILFYFFVPSIGRVRAPRVVFAWIHPVATTATVHDRRHLETLADIRGDYNVLKTSMKTVCGFPTYGPCRARNPCHDRWWFAVLQIVFRRLHSFVFILTRKLNKYSDVLVAETQYAPTIIKHVMSRCT